MLRQTLPRLELELCKPLPWPKRMCHHGTEAGAPDNTAAWASSFQKSLQTVSVTLLQLIFRAPGFRQLLQRRSEWKRDSQPPSPTCGTSGRSVCSLIKAEALHLPAQLRAWSPDCIRDSEDLCVLCQACRAPWKHPMSGPELHLGEGSNTVRVTSLEEQEQSRSEQQKTQEEHRRTEKDSLKTTP